MNASFKNVSLIAEIFLSFHKFNDTRYSDNEILLYSVLLIKYFFKKYVKMITNSIEAKQIF